MRVSKVVTAVAVDDVNVSTAERNHTSDSAKSIVAAAATSSGHFFKAVTSHSIVAIVMRHLGSEPVLVLPNDINHEDARDVTLCSASGTLHAAA